jgi:tetraacyldisaccharide 4'-kinase
MPWYAFLLSPFALIFGWLTELRNFLFDRGILKSDHSPIPTLIIGNLSIGGTGKTPHVEWFLSKLGSDFVLASLSRGYGRKTKGFMKAADQSSPEDIGDEPLQIYRKFNSDIPVFVGEKRVPALQKISQSEPNLNLVILDDAFQHRSLKGDFYILLTPFQLPFFEDQLLPMGRLREHRHGASRSDLVVVTKCPEYLTEAEKSTYRSSIRKHAGEKPVFFSFLTYGEPYLVSKSKTDFQSSVVLVSALADDRLFVEYANRNFEVLEAIHFSDHHTYSRSDAEIIRQLAEKHPAQMPVILTTEKDSQKLKSLSDQGILGEIAIFALPISVTFEPNEEESLLCIIREKFKTK